MALVVGLAVVAGVAIAVFAGRDGEDGPQRRSGSEDDYVTESPTPEQVDAARVFGALAFPESVEVVAMAYDDDRGGTYRLVLTVPPGDVAALLDGSGLTEEPYPMAGAAVVTVPGYELAPDAPVLWTQNQVGVPSQGQVVRQIALDESDPDTTTVHALLFMP